MPAAAFEPAIPASERLQAHVLYCAASGISQYDGIFNVFCDRIRNQISYLYFIF